MSNDIWEVLDANIVLLLEEPLKQTVSASSLIEDSELSSFLRKPVTMSQGLSFDPTLGTTTGMYQIESMRSQKTISLSALRIEVHDRSGESDLEKAQIPETMVALANALQVGTIKATGANWEITFKLPEEIPASVLIREKLLQQDSSFLPQNIRPVGGTVRLFLSDHSKMMYTLAIEPRGQNAQTTNELWMTCNANLPYPEGLSVELLKEMFQKCYSLLFEVKKSLFSVF